MGIEAIESIQGETVGDRAPLGLVGGEIDSLAVANLVEAKVMGEAIGH